MFFCLVHLLDGIGMGVWSTRFPTGKPVVLVAFACRQVRDLRLERAGTREGQERFLVDFSGGCEGARFGELNEKPRPPRKATAENAEKFYMIGFWPGYLRADRIESGETDASMGISLERRQWPRPCSHHRGIWLQVRSERRQEIRTI